MNYFFRPLFGVLGGVKAEKVEILTKTLKMVVNFEFYLSGNGSK
jgi:hypothetical protein